MNRFDSLVSELCAEIDDLREQLYASQADAKHWREKYTEELNASIQHSKVLMGNVLGALLDRQQAVS